MHWRNASTVLIGPVSGINSIDSGDDSCPLDCNQWVSDALFSVAFRMATSRWAARTQASVD